jgi:protein-tyrosine phosphatase
MRLWGSRESVTVSDKGAVLQGFIDIHTHVLPGVDDGAGSFEETVQLLQIASETGTRAVVATPHMFLDLYHNQDVLKIRDRHAGMVDRLQQLSKEPDYAFLKDFDVFLGAENYFSTEFLDAARVGKVLTLNGSRYLLVEFSPFLTIANIRMAVTRILDLGFTPVIAHPERNMLIQEDPSRMRSYAETGCILQVNADSILNHSRRIAKTARSLLKEKVPLVIASDGHRPQTRPVQLQAAAIMLREKFPLDEIKRWMCDRTKAIVENRPV